MKNIKRIALFASVLVAAILVFSCSVNVNTDDKKDDTGGVDFTNHSTDAAIRVRNLTNQRLVLFKNDLREDMILGGVDPNAGGDGWGIKKDPKFFNSTGEFSMIILTLEQYTNNKSNLSNQTPFTRVYVFYNAAGENEILYEISDKLGGNYILQVENPSNLNVELRQGGVSGPTLGYAPAGMQSTRLYVQGGDLDFFPVFKRYNAQRNIVETIYPKGAQGPWMESFVFDGPVVPQAYNIRETLKGVANRTSGVAYLKIVNSSGGAARLYKGSSMVYNSAGVSYIANDSVGKEFEVLMPSSNGVFDSFITINNYTIGPTGGAVPIYEKGTNNISLKLYSDKSYTVTFTGRYNDNNLKAEIDLDAATDLSFDFFTFN